jgi:alpha-tubulin suppressor-like RCC1 family protein
LGSGDKSANRNSPSLIPTNGINFIQVSAGFAHSLTLDEDGLAYSFGQNIVI